MTANRPVPQFGLALRWVTVIHMTDLVSPHHTDTKSLAVPFGRRIPQPVNQAGAAAMADSTASAVWWKHSICKQITYKAVAAAVAIMRPTAVPLPVWKPALGWRSGLFPSVVQDSGSG